MEKNINDKECKKDRKITPRKYIAVIEKMKNTGDFSLDLTKFTTGEISFIADLVHNDNMFEFFRKCQDTDIQKIKTTLLMLDANERYQKMLQEEQHGKINNTFRE